MLRRTFTGLLLATALVTPALAEDVTIKYMTFSAAPNYLKELDATIAAFEAEHPGIKVEYETAAWDAYFTKLQTVVAAKQAPDAFELNYENFVTYADKGALARTRCISSSAASASPIRTARRCACPKAGSRTAC
jgi:multiple sugar transport system substrate-binding protein